MDKLENQLVKYLADTPLHWFPKGYLLEMKWQYEEKGTIKTAIADTISRSLRRCEESKRIAQRPSGKSCEYRFLPPDKRKIYIPYTMREDKSILFKLEESFKQRTLPQNNSIHKFCNDLAGELNGKGKYMQLVLKPDYELKWDMKAVKENLYKPIAKALYGVESTTELDTDQVSKVHHQLMIMLVEKFPEIDYVDFPSEENTESYYQSLNEK